MRTYDVAYVKNPAPPSIPMAQNIDEIDLKTLVRNYLCGKSQGKISECMKCPAPCAYGKRALELAYPKPDEENPYPRYNKSLIELAREENEKKREAAQKSATSSPEKQANKEAEKKKRIPVEEWYYKAYESDNPLQVVMNTFGLNEKKAKMKVYEAWHRHPELKEKPLWQPKNNETKDSDGSNQEAKPETKPEMKPETKPAATPETAPVATTGSKKDELLGPLENKINDLMNQQEEYKSKYEHYLKLYNETTSKVNALYDALTILNE